MNSLLRSDNIQAYFIPFIVQDGVILFKLQGTSLWVVAMGTNGGPRTVLLEYSKEPEDKALSVRK